MKTFRLVWKTQPSSALGGLARSNLMPLPFFFCFKEKNQQGLGQHRLLPHLQPCSPKGPAPLAAAPPALCPSGTVQLNSQVSSSAGTGLLRSALKPAPAAGGAAREVLSAELHSIFVPLCQLLCNHRVTLTGRKRLKNPTYIQ